MSSITLGLRRHQLIGAAALAMLVAIASVGRSEPADAGPAAPPGEGIAVVYVAVGTNFPDSLGIGPGAGGHGAPIIILPTNPPIPSISAAELIRLDPRRVVIVGGTAVISASQEASLTSLLPNATIERIAGADRYETNALFSEATFPVEEWASVSAAAFTAPNPSTNVATISADAAWNTTNGTLRATIQLPDGAEILELRINARDFDEENDVTVTLRRVSSNVTAQISQVTTQGSSGNQTRSTTDVHPSHAVVDNSTSAYTVDVTGASHSFFSFIQTVMVRYRLGVPGA